MGDKQLVRFHDKKTGELVLVPQRDRPTVEAYERFKRPLYHTKKEGVKGGRSKVD